MPGWFFQLSNYPARLVDLTRPSLQCKTCWYKRWLLVAGWVATLYDNWPSTQSSLVRRHDSASQCWCVEAPEPPRSRSLRKPVCGWVGGGGGWQAGRRESIDQTVAGCSSTPVTQSDIRPVSDTRGTTRLTTTQTTTSSATTPGTPPAAPPPPWQGAQVEQPVPVTSQPSAELISWVVSESVSRYQQTLGQTPWQTPIQYKTTLDQITL